MFKVVNSLEDNTEVMRNCVNKQAQLINELTVRLELVEDKYIRLFILSKEYSARIVDLEDAVGDIDFLNSDMVKK